MENQSSHIFQLETKWRHHSAFNSVINYQANPKTPLLGFTKDRKKAGPLTIYLGENHPLFKAPPAEFLLKENTIIEDLHPIELPNLQENLIQDCFTFTKFPRPNTKEIKLIIEQIDQLFSKQSINSLANLWSTPRGPTSAFEQEMFKTIGISFQKLLMSKSEKQLLGILKDFSNIGQGLTPSGDDFICGCLSAYHFFNQLSPREISKYRTKNDFVNTMLWQIERNILPESFSTFFQQMTNPKKIKSVLINISKIGHSSGLDWLSGVKMALIKEIEWNK